MQPHLPVWVLVADSSRARIFEVKIGSDAFELVSEFPHAGGHKHHHDGAADAHNHAAHTQFARELCHALSQGLNSHRCGRIVIAANPEFLGHLRDVADVQSGSDGCAGRKREHCAKREPFEAVHDRAIEIGCPRRKTRDRL